MRDYIVIEALSGADREAMEAAGQGLAAMGAWRIAARRESLIVLVETAHPPPVTLLPGVGGVVIGDLFDAAAAKDGRAWPLEVHLLGGRRSPLELAQDLVERAWGRYVAVLTSEDGAARVLRDPVGALEALTWRRDGLAIVASRLPDDPDLWPRDLAIDWTVVAAILRQKAATSDRAPLKAVESLTPGVLTQPGQSAIRLWSPAAFARRPDRRAKPEDLARVIDGVVAAWAGGRGQILCEISGGIDSAIIAASLRSALGARFSAINHYWPQIEADERPYAQAVAELVDADLTCVARGELVLNGDKLAFSAAGPRPSHIGGDPDHDADLAMRLSGGGALFTGRGGDAVLFQMPSTELAGDLLRGAPAMGGRVQALARLAQRRGRTAWSLIGEAARRWTSPVAFAPAPGFLAERVAGAAPALHPWLRDLSGVSPAKRVQIRSITNNLGSFGESLRHRAGDVIDPLLSQPVLELVLTIPAPRLALGPTDRPFARAAFAGRLPASVLQRHGKGDVAYFFSRSLAASLTFLRPYLLDGRLVSEGLVRRDRLEEILTPENLIWNDEVSEVFVALAVEAWVRAWEARIDGAGSRAVARPAA